VRTQKGGRENIWKLLSINTSSNAPDGRKVGKEEKGWAGPYNDREKGPFLPSSIGGKRGGLTFEIITRRRKKY